MRKFFSDIWNDELVFVDFFATCLNIVQVLAVANPVVSAGIAAAIGGLQIFRRRLPQRLVSRVAKRK